MNETSYDRMVIVTHLKENLGQPDDAWTSEEGHNCFSIARFPDQPGEGINTFATAGLSSHILSMGRDLGTTRMELLFAAYARYSSEDIASFMLWFCDLILSKHQAFVSGHVVGPFEWPIIEAVEVNAVYAPGFSLFPDSVHLCRGTPSPTVIAWVLPIHADEAAYIKTHGCHQFEDIIEAKAPDLWNLNRESVV